MIVRRRAAPLAVLVALVAWPALAGEREWREQKKLYDEALTKVEAGAGDAKAQAEALAALRGAAAKMMTEHPQKTVEALVARGLPGKRAASEVALDALSRVTDARAARDLVKAFEEAEGRTKRLLVEALRGLPGEEATLALVRALRDKSADVRAAAASGLGSRGAAAKEQAEPPLTKALKDEALRVRWVAARALEQLGGARPKGFEEPALSPADLPARFDADRVALVVDVSAAAGEEAFADAFAPVAPVDTATPPAGGPRGGRRGAPEAPKGPKVTSPHALAVAAVEAALGTLGEVGAHVVRLGATGGSRAWREGFAPLKSKDAAEAAAFLGRPATDRGRDVLPPLRRLLELETPPQVVHLFLCGPPEGRGAAAAEETVAAVRELAWGRDVTIHVVAFEVPPATQPTDERGRVALAEAQGLFGKFVTDLAAAGRGRCLRVSLTRVDASTAAGPAAAGPATPAAGGPDKPALDLDLTKAVTTRDVDKVRAALRDAAEKADAPAEKLIEDVAACPDKKLVPLVLDALRQAAAPDGKRAVAEAVIRGLNRNADPAALDEALAALKAVERTNVALQLLLVRAVGRSPAPVAAGLLDGLERLGPDATRVAWQLLAGRPAAELQAQQGRLARAARGHAGLTDFFARTALALASGAPPPPTVGLETKDGAFLPERFVAGGVALVIDDQRDMEQVFHTPPPPAPKPAGPDDRARRGRGREPAEPEAPKPTTRLGAAVLEAKRALRSLAQGGAKANLILTSGRTWRPAVEALEKPRLDEAERFLDEVRPGPSRDPFKALKAALEDPGVEVVHVLLCGPPIRSPGATDPAELLRLVRAVQRERAVAVHVVYVLGPVAEGAAAAAARKDLLTQLDATYRALAEESGGRVLVREALATLAAPAAPAGGAAPPPAPPAPGGEAPPAGGGG